MARRPTYNTAFGSLPTPRDQMGFSTGTGTARGIDTYDAMMQKQQARQREQQQQQYNAYMGQTGQRADGPPPIAGWQTQRQPAAPSLPAQAAPRAQQAVAQAPARQPQPAGQPSAPQPTFAEMQAKGRARPAPPPAGGPSAPQAPTLPEQASERAGEALETRLARQLGMRDERQAGRPAPEMAPMRPMAVAEPMEAPSMAPAVEPPTPEADILPALRNVLGQEVAAMGAPEQVAPPAAPAPAPAAAPVAPAVEPAVEPAVAQATEAAADPAVVEEVAALLGVAPADVQMAVGSMTPEDVTSAADVTGGEGTGVTATRPGAEYAAREAGVQAAQAKIQQAEEQIQQLQSLQGLYYFDPETGVWTGKPGDYAEGQTLRFPSPQEAQAQLAAAQQELAAAQATPAMLSTETARADLQTQLQQALGMAGGGAGGVGVTGAPMAGGGMAGGIVGDLQQRLLRQLGVLEEAPSRFESEGFVKAREAALANLEAQYGAERSKLEEELARRGLSASSIAAGRMGDLAGQQARALATMEADLLKEAAMTEAQDRALLLQNYQQLLSTMSEDERAKLDRDLRRYEIDGTLGMRARELQQEAALRGRSMDIEEANNLARIQIAREEIAQRDRQFTAEFGLKRETFTADQEYRMQQLQISRDELAIKKDQLEQQNKQFYDSLTETQRNNLALEELSRERNTLSREELTQRQAQWQQEQAQRESINRINAIVQLSPFLADMTAEDAVKFFSSLGIPINADIWKQVKSGATTGGTAAGGTTGGTGGYTGGYPNTGAGGDGRSPNDTQP